MTTMKFFAPPSAWTRFPACVARWYTARATAVEPTKETARMSGMVADRLDDFAPPLTRLTTPGGRSQLLEELEDPLLRERHLLGRLAR
jgi:hypothetical protein